MPDNVLRYLFIIPILLSGCDDRERQLRTWQQEQAAELQRQSQDNTAAARALVEADAASRRQFVELEQAVQAERRELTEQFVAVDADRKALAAARERVPLLATAFQGLAALLLGLAALVVCGRLLGRSSDPGEATELEETLILAVAGESDLLDAVRLRLREPTAAPAIEQSGSDVATALTSEARPSHERSPMSHIVTIQTEVRDPTAIHAACERLKLPAPVRGTAKLFTTEATGLLVALPRWRYPIVCKTDVGAIAFDNYGGKWGEQRELDRFVQAYAVEKACLEARKQGHEVSDQALTDGSIKLTVRVGGAN